MHRYEKLRAGAIRTDQGWNVQDFASSFFNPDPVEITVSMKLVSDDPKFLFRTHLMLALGGVLRVRCVDLECHDPQTNMRFGIGRRLREAV